MKIKRYSLCAQLILPTVGASIRAFGKYFIEGYVFRDCSRVVVVMDYQKSVDDKEGKFTRPFKYNPIGGTTQVFGRNEYTDRYYINGRLYILLSYHNCISHEHLPCAKNMLAGKYSQVKPETLERVINSRIHRYRHLTEEGKVLTSRVLIAISQDKSARKALRKKLEVELGVSLPENAELLDRISEENIVDSVIEVVRKYEPDFDGDIADYSPKGKPLPEKLVF